eukprot:m.36163 g.36163  ORF g.36163 m.36163 type:complete len:324 (-) comp12454_c0_seq1:65-1036(-)
MALAINNEPWLFSRHHVDSPPSVVEHGLKLENEQICRLKGASTILTLASSLNIASTTTSSAIVMLQRFYMLQSFKQFDAKIMASCCLFVALKTQARPTDVHRASRIALKDFLKWVSHVCYDKKLTIPSPEYEALADKVKLYERVLLPSLGFDTLIELPHQHLLLLQEGHHDLLKACWQRANSIMASKFVLLYGPRLLAAGIVQSTIDHCASKAGASPKTDKPAFWQLDASKLERIYTTLIGSQSANQLIDPDDRPLMEQVASLAKEINTWRNTHKDVVRELQRTDIISVAYKTQGSRGSSRVGASSAEAMDGPTKRAKQEDSQ